MHHIYRTEAVILSSRPSGESGKYLVMLSKDYGLLKMEAQAVRAKDSKLKHAIQDYSICDISFVRGKSGNRLVNARFVHNLYYDLKDEKLLKTLSKIFLLIEKMIIDEEENNIVYDLIVGAYTFLKEQFTDKLEKGYSTEFLKAFELALVYKILTTIGYISKDVETNFIFEDELDQSLVNKVQEMSTTSHKEVIRLINQAIRESHL